MRASEYAGGILATHQARNQLWFQRRREAISWQFHFSPRLFKLCPTVHDAREEHKSDLILKGRPKELIRTPVPTKKKWDAVLDLHLKFLLFCVQIGLNNDDAHEYADFLATVFSTSSPGTPSYLKIQLYQLEHVAKHVARAKNIKDYKPPIKRSSLNQIWAPGNNLLYKVDPKGARSLDSVQAVMRKYRDIYRPYTQQTGAAADILPGWTLETYLDVMESYSRRSASGPEMSHPEGGVDLAGRGPGLGGRHRC
jgi:hypothetical protein